MYTLTHYSLSFPRSGVTAIKLRLDSPFSLREKVRMRGSNKAFFLIFILLGNRSLRCSTSCIRAATVFKIKPALQNQGSILSLFLPSN